MWFFTSVGFNGCMFLHVRIIVGTMSFDVENNTIRPPKKPLFYGWTDLPSRVSRSGVFVFVYFFFPGIKNNPKNIKILKKIRQFCRKVLGKYVDLFSKIFRFWSKNGWFYKILEKLEKKSTKTENLGQSRPKNSFLLFVCLFFFVALT